MKAAGREKMGRWRRLCGIFRKEVNVQSRHRMLILNRLLIGPLISGLTAGTLYAGFFRENRALVLGGLTSENFAPQILFGLLAHSFLNSGYYYLSWKIVREWSDKTLPLFWIHASPSWLVILGFSSVEALRCGFFAALGVTAISFVKPFAPFGLVIVVLTFGALFVLGIILGSFRSILAVLNEGHAEFLDQFYMAFIFLACFYIPKDVLPKFVRPWCEWNPAYQAVTALRRAWLDAPTAGAPLGAFAVGVLGAFSILVVTWHFAGPAVRERTFE